MKHRVSCLSLLMGFALPAVLSAQADPNAPPPVLSIYREIVKPGKAPAHTKLETQWTRALVAAKYPVNMLAMETMTGPAEAWFMSGYPSWAEYEAVNQRMNNDPALSAVTARFVPLESEFLSDGRGMVATYRADLSYITSRPLATTRYFTVARYQVRPGHTSEFEDVRKMAKQAHEAVKAADGYAVYQVASGAPAGTFFIFAARKSLSELDDAPTVHGPAYMAALGGPEGQKKLDGLTSNAVAVTESILFSFNPAMSYPSQAWIDADPAYWKPKPMMAAPKQAEPKKP